MRLWILVLCGLLVVPVAQAEDRVLAVVNGTKIYEKDARQVYAQYPDQTQSFEAALPDITRRLIDEKLLVEQALRENLSKDPVVQEAIRVASNRILQKAYITRTMKDQITEDRLKEAYEEFKTKFDPQEERQVRHILVKQKKQAEQVLQELKDGARFEDLAKKYSIDANAEQGGDLSWFTADVMDEAFSKAVFVMKVGDVSDPPIKTRFGWHVAQVVGVRHQREPSYIQMRSKLKQVVNDRVFDEILTGLRKNATIKNMVAKKGS